MADDIGTPAQSADRGRSTIEFPYFDLDDAVSLAKAVQALGGHSCGKDQLAARIGMTATGGGFSTKLSAAKMFGLLHLERGQVELTDLGIRICDARQEKTARVEAFLAVPLFKAIYEKFRGTALPPNSGLEGTIQTMGAAPKQKERARQVLQRSAKQAGFFEMSSDRLVIPPMVKVSDGKPAGSAGTPPSAGTQYKPNGGSEASNRHPLIQGLIETLPPEFTDWSHEDRANWLQGAAGIFAMIYKDSTGSQKKIVVTLS